MNADVISLSLPARPQYILAVRLAVSAVAERVGFGIEDIEDLKVASAEACTLLFAAGAVRIDLRMIVCDGLSIEFVPAGTRAHLPETAEAKELGRYLLDALVDACDLNYDGDRLTAVRFKKNLAR